MARNWNSLSDAYRARLERGGITRGEYEAGANLSAARGHKATPEHPRQAENDRQRFQAYIFERDRLVQAILREKSQKFSAAANYNAKRSRWNVEHFQDGRARSLASLRRALEALKGQASSWEDMIEDLEEEDINALYYH